MHAVLCGIVLPILLVGSGLYFGFRLRFFWIIHPIRTLRTLREAAVGQDTPPFAALTLALAGTLGVGNIAGVATAITAGGSGAVFWMLVGAIAAMGVKYAEVFLAVHFRRERIIQGKRTHYGGAMYFIRDGLKARMGAQRSAFLGGIFAVLCIINALLTGNIIQVHAAVQCVPISPVWFGLAFAAASVWIATRGIRRVSALTSVLIPVLAGLYIFISLVILLFYHSELPGIVSDIWQNAWGIHSAVGGAAGIGMRRAVQYGITRGIFSNEAGCGTAPTAHAAAETRSPHHQGCFGIFEVFADTVLLCTLTAFVILLYRNDASVDGVALSVAAYSDLFGKIFGSWGGACIRIFMQLTIVLFAFATVVCQTVYGTEAIGYFTARSGARRIFLFLSVLGIMCGTVISSGIMWTLADGIIAVMTTLNLLCLWKLRDFLPNGSSIQRY